MDTGNGDGGDGLASPASLPTLVFLLISRASCFLVDVPSEILFVLPLGSGLSGLSHVGPVRQRLQQAADVLVLGPGGTDGELLLTLDNGPEQEATASMNSS